MSTPQLNGRIALMRMSATLAINQRALQLRSQGTEIAHFGFGQAPFPVPPRMARELAERASENRYLPCLGLPELRAAIARRYRASELGQLHPDRIAIGPGSKELIYHLLYVLEGPLLLPMPSWVSYAAQGHMLAKQVLPVPIEQQPDSYRCSARDLVAALPADCGQAVLILNSPSNPTGQVHSEEELAALAKVCRARGVYVIADEMYAQLDHSRALAPGIGRHCPERTIITGGLAKAFSAGGWRLGFAAACDPSLQPLFEALGIVISETYSCVCAPVQYAACLAYEGVPEIEAFVRDCAALHAHACGLIATELRSALDLSCPRCEGGFYLFPSFARWAGPLRRRGLTTSRELAAALLDECGCAVLPGEDFGMPAEELVVRLAPVDYDGALALQCYLDGGRELAALARLAPDLYRPMLAGCARIQAWLATLESGVLKATV